MTNQDFYNTLKAEKERLMNASKQALNDCQTKHGEMAKTWNIINALESLGKFGTQELSNTYEAYEKASHASMLADNHFDDIDEAIDKINELMSLYAD